MAADFLTHGESDARPGLAAFVAALVVMVVDVASALHAARSATSAHALT